MNNERLLPFAHVPEAHVSVPASRGTHVTEETDAVAGGSHQFSGSRSLNFPPPSIAKGRTQLGPYSKSSRGRGGGASYAYTPRTKYGGSLPAHGSRLKKTYL